MSKINSFPWCVWQLCSYVGINICSAVSFDYAIANTGENISVYNFVTIYLHYKCFDLITTAFCSITFAHSYESRYYFINLYFFNSGTNQSQLFTVMPTDIACNNHNQKIVANIKQPMVLIWI